MASSRAFRRSIRQLRVPDELISPELALVCPDLRAKAIAALPAQPWLPIRPYPTEVLVQRAHPVTAARMEQLGGEDSGFARAVGAYALGKAADLLAITAAIAVFVLLLAAVAGIVRS